jgi:hypothetical protein
LKNRRQTLYCACSLCPEPSGVLRLVSAHSASQQWRRSYLVLTELGYDAWLEGVYAPNLCNISSMNTTGMRCAILAAFYNRWNEDLHERALPLIRKLIRSGACLDIAERHSQRPELFSHC